MDSFKLINEEGKFSEGIQERLQLDEEKSPLAVVSIIGVLSRGKSTLLNHMFDTKFDVMDAKEGRKSTTKGIWVAKYATTPGCILIIDTEGSDGRERKGDETFARQTALFAMAISRVVIVNMMCTDVGTESCGGWPLLRTTCEVMLQEFGRKRRQITLLFVLRDKAETPLHLLKKDITAKMGEILGEMTEHRVQGDAVFSELFKIEVRATSHYEYKRREFELEVDELKRWIISQTKSTESTSTSIPTSDFPTHAKEIWDDVKKKRDLELSSIVIMIARELCDRIANKQRDSFDKDEKWLKIKENVEKTDVEKNDSILQVFRKDVSNLISTYLCQYNEEAKCHDNATRKKRGEQLTKELLEIMKPTHLRLAERMRSKKLQDFIVPVLDKLPKKDVTAIQVQSKLCVEKFDYQLKDAFIELAYRTYAPSQRDALKKGIESFIAGVDEINTEMAKRQMDRKSTWIKIAQGVSAAFSMTAAVVGSVLAPPLAPAVHLAAAGVPNAIHHVVLNFFGL